MVVVVGKSCFRCATPHLDSVQSPVSQYSLVLSVDPRVPRHETRAYVLYIEPRVGGYPTTLTLLCTRTHILIHIDITTYSRSPAVQDSAPSAHIPQPASLECATLYAWCRVFLTRQTFFLHFSSVWRDKIRAEQFVAALFPLGIDQIYIVGARVIDLCLFSLYNTKHPSSQSIETVSWLIQC